MSEIVSTRLGSFGRVYNSLIWERQACVEMEEGRVENLLQPGKKKWPIKGSPLFPYSISDSFRSEKFTRFKWNEKLFKILELIIFRLMLVRTYFHHLASTIYPKSYKTFFCITPYITENILKFIVTGIVKRHGYRRWCFFVSV